MFEFNQTIKEDFNVYSFSKDIYENKNLDILVMDKSSSDWRKTNNKTCVEHLVEDLNYGFKNSCLESLPTESYLLCGDFVSWGNVFSNFLLWACIMALPHLILSMAALGASLKSQSSCRSFCPKNWIVKLKLESLQTF